MYANISISGETFLDFSNFLTSASLQLIVKTKKLKRATKLKFDMIGKPYLVKTTSLKKKCSSHNDYADPAEFYATNNFLRLALLRACENLLISICQPT